MFDRWWIACGLALGVSQAEAADLSDVSCRWVAANILTDPGQLPNGGPAERQLLDQMADHMAYSNLGGTSLGSSPRYPTDSQSRYQLSILVLETCADHPEEMMDVRLAEMRWFEDSRGLHVDGKSFD